MGFVSHIFMSKHEIGLLIVRVSQTRTFFQKKHPENDKVLYRFSSAYIFMSNT